MNNMQLEIDKYIKYRQKKNKLNNIKINDSDNYKFEFAYTNEDIHIVDIYKNDKLLIRATYEILGCYNVISSIWVWSWAISQIEKNLTENTKNKAKELHDILLNNRITKDIEEYLYYLTNDTFFISYKNLEKLLNFGLYMTKNKYILSHKITEKEPKIIEFILIKKITQERNI